MFFVVVFLRSCAGPSNYKLSIIKDSDPQQKTAPIDLVGFSKGSRG